jgi:hypothetical protein
LEKGVESLSSEAGEKLIFFAQTINNTLELGLPSKSLDCFNILKPTNLRVVLEKIKNLGNPDFEFFFKKLITNGIFFKFPFSFDYYCPHYSSNKLAGISGVHLRSLLLKNYFPKNSKMEIFLHFIGNFMASYISVKIFNPYKKCDLYIDIENKFNLKNFSPQEKNTFSFAKLVLDNLRERNLKGEIFESKTYYDLYFSSRIVGYFFAEVFHQELETIPEKNKKFVTSLIFNKIFQLEDLFELQQAIFARIGMEKFKKRYF